ncbi:hypothetical protein B0H10DRAFT_2236837 [Mycena sp. CBHHK59/15]|nr:hypothetical protein B0H10DRAFT_2236837 [Mycena sp. CBHHK59/15]
MENNGYTSGRFNFPPSQYMVPPPVPYLPPERFYGHPMPFYPAGAAIDASETTDLSTRKRAGSDAEAQVLLVRGALEQEACQISLVPV